MGEFKGRLVQPESTNKGLADSPKRLLEKLLAGISVSTAAAIALAACGIAEGSNNPQTQPTEPVPLSSPTPDTLNQLSSIELFNRFITNQIESGHQLSTPTVFSSSEGKQLNPEQNQSIEQLVNSFVGLAQNQKILNFSPDGLGVNTDSLGQIMIEDTLVFDFGKKGKAGMFLVSSETGNKAYYLSNNGEVATQLVFSIRYKDGTVEAFFDPKQVEAALKETDPSLIESTNWNGIFMRPEVMGDNPADSFFATTTEMQYEGEGTPFLYNVLSLDQQQNLAMLDPGTLDFGLFEVETATNAEPTEEPTPAPIFGSKVLMSILAPTPTASEVVPAVESTPTAEPTQTPEQALEEFMTSFEFKKSLNDYSVAMGIDEQYISFFTETKFNNGTERSYLVFKPDVSKLDENQGLHIENFNSLPSFYWSKETNQWMKLGWHDLVKDYDFIYANLMLGRQINNPAFDNTIIKDLGGAIIGYHTRWDKVEPTPVDSPNKIDLKVSNSVFSYLKKLEATKQEDLFVLAQHLVWQEQLPDYVLKLSGEPLRQAMINHIKNTVLAFDDNIDAWVVVNESETKPENKGKNFDFFYDRLGESYIVDAFKAAYEANPEITYLYSDFNNHTATGYKNWQTERVINLIQNEGIPISIGLHMRIDVSKPPTKEELKTTFLNYGVDIYLTEITLSLEKIPVSDKNRYYKQADVARTITEAVIEFNKEAEKLNYPNRVKFFGFYGFGDSMNFLEEANGKSNADPTPFDDNLNPKPAYYAILETLYRLLDS